VALQVSVDCASPQRLVAFWAAALGYVVEPPPEGFSTWNAYWLAVGVPPDELPSDGTDAADSIVDPTGIGPRVRFQQVPEPKTLKNRVHLDLKISGGRAVSLEQRQATVDAEVARLEELGASRLYVLGGEGSGVDHYAVVLQDPEGNEFCVT
jgi:hypothetical protein